MPNPYVNKVVQSNGTTLIDISDTTAVAADVASGKYFYLATGEKVEGTASGGGSVTWETMADQTCTITTYDGMRIITINGYDEPLSADETYRITWGDTQYICNTIADPVGFTQDGYYIGNSGVFGSQYEDTGEPFALYRTSSTRMIGATNDTASSVYVKIEKQVTSSATLITKAISANGTYSASSDGADGYSQVTVNVQTGGSSMNTQTAQSTTRRNNTALGSITSLTCEVAGTYDVYWSCARSSTSGTWGSRLYINGTAYSTENTAWSNHVQNNHLTGVTIPANATVAVYGRSRSGYYIYVPQLTIEQTA